MKDIQDFNEIESKVDLRTELLRYVSFWPYFLISFIFFMVSIVLILKYNTEAKYNVFAKIEIIDKAQDSEMALPTAMTVFNRSMINLENEIGVLTSHSLHSKVVSKLESNVKFYTLGRIKETENHYSEFFKDFDFELKTSPKSIGYISKFELEINDNNLTIFHFDYTGELKNEYTFSGLDSFDKEHDLPFNIRIKDYSNDFNSKKIVFIPYDAVVSSFAGSVLVSETGLQSDQLDISLIHPNILIANDYINTLISEFDRDGITDRQSEYKRTMEFVDIRSKILEKELSQIELNKQSFKEANNISDLTANAEINIKQQYLYDQELSNVISQKELIKIFNEVLTAEKNIDKLLPAEIGIQNEVVNRLVFEFNEQIKEKERFLFSAGPDNYIIKTIDKQIYDIYNNILLSINKYEESLDAKIQNYEQKELEFKNIYSSVPKNEKILRSINRELEIKESLFLLLLQKREEAAINYAVVKPSVKVIDFSRSNGDPVSPNKSLYYFSAIILGFLIPFGTLYVWFWFDNKVHTRKHIEELFKNYQIPFLGEIPFVSTDKLNTLPPISDTRNVISEAFRIILSNFNFSFKMMNDKGKSKVILVTSSIKGEGKTFVAVNTANMLASKEKKVLLIGCDLRNPQLHKFFNLKKNILGISNLLTNEDFKNLDNYIYQFDSKSQANKDLSVMFSGPIPPNPSLLLESKHFEKLIHELSLKYDYLILDTAPCLLVSDTFLISKYSDATLYVLRAAYSDKSLKDFITDNFSKNKLKSMNFILNSVGKSASYGYKYGYQYGYKYGYGYGYNYGYGYGYGSDKDETKKN